MHTRRKILFALACATAGAAVGCGDSVETGSLSAEEEEANRKTNDAMADYAKQQKTKKRQR